MVSLLPYDTTSASNTAAQARARDDSITQLEIHPRNLKELLPTDLKRETGEMVKRALKRFKPTLFCCTSLWGRV